MAKGNDGFEVSGGDSVGLLSVVELPIEQLNGSELLRDEPLSPSFLGNILVSGTQLSAPSVFIDDSAMDLVQPNPFFSGRQSRRISLPLSPTSPLLMVCSGVEQPTRTAASFDRFSTIVPCFVPEAKAKGLRDWRRGLMLLSRLKYVSRQL